MYNTISTKNVLLSGRFHTHLECLGHVQIQFFIYVHWTDVSNYFSYISTCDHIILFGTATQAVKRRSRLVKMHPKGATLLAAFVCTS